MARRRQTFAERMASAEARGLTGQARYGKGKREAESRARSAARDAEREVKAARKAAAKKAAATRRKKRPALTTTHSRTGIVETRTRSAASLVKAIRTAAAAGHRVVISAAFASGAGDYRTGRVEDTSGGGGNSGGRSPTQPQRGAGPEGDRGTNPAGTKVASTGLRPVGPIDGGKVYLGAGPADVVPGGVDADDLAAFLGQYVNAWDGVADLAAGMPVWDTPDELGANLDDDDERDW